MWVWQGATSWGISQTSRDPLLAWHCARDDKLYILAGRMGLGTEPSQQQRYYRISSQSKAAEAPFIFLASLCDGWSQLRLSCTEHFKQWSIFLSQQMFWILGLCIKVYALKGLYHCQFSVSEVWGQRQQKCSFWFPCSVFYCNRMNKNNINAWRIRKENVLKISIIQKARKNPWY